MNSSCTDSTWCLDARGRSCGQTPDVRVNTDGTALSVLSSHVHQHYNIPKMQSSIICLTEIHLNTLTRTVITTIILTLLLLTHQMHLPIAKCFVGGSLLFGQQVPPSPFSPDTPSLHPGKKHQQNINSAMHGCIVLIKSKVFKVPFHYMFSSLL